MPDPTLFTADLDGPPIPLRHPWQWCVGSGHATLALRADWQAHLAQAHRDLGVRFVRFHGILDDDMGTLICQSDALLYSFFNTDRIFDFLLSIGMKPVVELSFMPRTLSSGGNIVFHYQGNITPPKDVGAWGTLVHKLVAHWVDRYGIDEVRQWPIECWNEPNLPAFWTGTQADYFALYRATAAAIRAVDSRLQVGGPVTAGNAWLPEFSAFCAAEAVACDFISTHYYPTDPFGAIDTDTVTQLEHAPPDVMRTRAVEARAVAAHRPLFYTEWSISSNPRDPLHDGAFAAALAVRIAMSVDDVVDGYSYWTFSDIFEENYFPSVPYHGGFGMMNLYGVPKPIYRAFEMMRSLGAARVDVAGTHPNVAVWVGADDAGTVVLLINQAMPRHAIDDEPVTVRLEHGATRAVATVTVERIDDAHANPARAWQAMGSPEYPTPAEVATLQVASRPVAEPVTFAVDDGTLSITLELAPQSVNRLRVGWRAA
jgi:xylan 1,4-beta-xylosidase